MGGCGFLDVQPSPQLHYDFINGNEYSLEEASLFRVCFVSISAYLS